MCARCHGNYGRLYVVTLRIKQNSFVLFFELVVAKCFYQLVGISSQILIDINHINNCNIFHDKNKNIYINCYIIVIKG